MKLSFSAKLERLAPGIEYWAVTVPLKITQAIGTIAAVPVWAQVNGSKPFQVSLYTQGGGRHGMRIKASVRKEAKAEGGDRVKIRITVVDRKAEVELPKDLIKALKSDGVLDAFKSLPNGKKRYTVRLIDAAAKPETRAKRIQEAVELGHQKREKSG